MKFASSSQISPGFADGWLMTGGFVSGGTVVGEGPGDVVGTGAGDVVGGDVGEGGVVVAPGVVVPGLVGEVGLVENHHRSSAALPDHRQIALDASRTEVLITRGDHEHDVEIGRQDLLPCLLSGELA
jgi:hypothetical protein